METKPSAAVLQARVKQEAGGSQTDPPPVKPRGLSLALKTQKPIKEEPQAVEAVISLLDEDLPSPIPVPVRLFFALTRARRT